MNTEDKKVVIRDHDLQQSAGMNESSMNQDQVNGLVKKLRAQGHNAHARVDEATGEVAIKKMLTD